MNIGVTSIRGKVRPNDEDSILVLTSENVNEKGTDQRALCVVADGMGGGEAGEVASKIAVDTIRAEAGYLVVGERPEEGEVLKTIASAILKANSAIMKYAKEHKIAQMGTTTTMSFLLDEELYVANVGDSRTYVIGSPGGVERRTKDNSYVQELVDSGVITLEDARKHPRRNEITRVVGIDDELQVDTYTWRLFEGDSVLMCCDGLWEAFPEQNLVELVREGKSAQPTVQLLVETANRNDGSDNISAVLYRPDVRTPREEQAKKVTEPKDKKAGGVQKPRQGFFRSLGIERTQGRFFEATRPSWLDSAK